MDHEDILDVSESTTIEETDPTIIETDDVIDKILSESIEPSPSDSNIESLTSVTDPLPSTVDVEIEEEPSPPIVTDANDPISANLNNSENVFHLDIIPDLFASIKGPDWLRQQPDDSYVLQIISASDIENVRKLLNGIPDISEQLAGYTKYTPSGKPRYLVFYGLYQDKESAINSVSEIHPRIKSVNPWPTTINHVLRELDKTSRSLP